MIAPMRNKPDPTTARIVVQVLTHLASTYESTSPNTDDWFWPTAASRRYSNQGLCFAMRQCGRYRPQAAGQDLKMTAQEQTLERWVGARLRQ